MNPNISKEGTNHRFSSTKQPANRGRKPSKLKKWIKENNVGNTDFVAIFRNIIAIHTLEELEELVKDERKKKLPVIVALCISAFLRDMKTGTLTSANTILDRIMGKPTQPVEMNAPELSVTIMTPEERQKRIEELLGKRGEQPKKTGRK